MNDIYSGIVNIAANLGDAMTKAYCNVYYRGKVRGACEAVSLMLGVSISEAHQILIDIARIIRKCEMACKRDGYAFPRGAAIWAANCVPDKLVNKRIEVD